MQEEQLGLGKEESQALRSLCNEKQQAFHEVTLK